MSLEQLFVGIKSSADLPTVKLEQVLARLAAWIAAHPLLALILLLSVLVLLVGLWGATRIYLARGHKQREAAQRAEALLRENLSDEQYQQLQKQGYLEIPSWLHPGRRYRIPRRAGRVQVVEGGRVVGELCVIALESVPDADLVLTQKWMCESDEQGYLTTANWIRGIPLARGYL